MIFKAIQIGSLRIEPPSVTSGCVVKVGGVDLLRTEVEDLIQLLQEALS